MNAERNEIQGIYIDGTNEIAYYINSVPRGDRGYIGKLFCNKLRIAGELRLHGVINILYVADLEEGPLAYPFTGFVLPHYGRKMKNADGLILGFDTRNRPALPTINCEEINRSIIFGVCFGPGRMQPLPGEGAGKRWHGEMGIVEECIRS